MKRRTPRSLIALALAWLTAACAAAAAEQAWSIEAEAHAVGKTVYRDERAGGGKCSVVKLDQAGPLMLCRRDLPSGDYVLTAWLEVMPVSIIHSLEVTVRAGRASRTLTAIQFDPAPGYQPAEMRFTHTGGELELEVSARGASGFDGMRKDVADEEKQAFQEMTIENTVSLGGEDKPRAGGDLMADMEGAPDVRSLSGLDLRVACDRLELRLVRPADCLVAAVEVDKVHYGPGETVKAVARLARTVPPERRAAPRRLRLVADDITEIDQARRVLDREVVLPPAGPVEVAFEYPLTPWIEFGHELRCTLMDGERELHSASQLYGCSRNVYRIGITAHPGPHHMQGMTREAIAAIMEANKRSYANYFEKFAWAPCDYSEMTPETELFWSGQTQYANSVSAIKALLEEARKRGIKGISYGKSCAGGISGFFTYQRHPEFFAHRDWGGPVSEAFNTFFLEQMLDGNYRFDNPLYSGWQHWASIWVRSDYGPAVDFGADELIASARMFGWDGVRWDGHFTGNMARCKKRLNDALPDYVHGYNIASASPGSKLFMPPADSLEDFQECARDHGLMMDESVRDWSSSVFSAGTVRPFYECLAREADYIKRIGGLPLFIMFDMGTAQDKTLDVLFGLAAGQRYTYATTPGQFAYGDLTAFLTRYSAFVWDDTCLVKDPGRCVTVGTMRSADAAEPWWQWSTWLRRLPDGRQQLLVNLVNPPGYRQFCSRVQTPPSALRDVSVSVARPAGARLVHAAHLSPDLLEGLVMLNPAQDGGRDSVVLPALRTWSIALFEYAPEGASALAWPAFPLTTPVEDAAAAVEHARMKSTPGKPPFYADYDNAYDVDAEREQKLALPDDLAPERNGVRDVLHCRGPYFWLNPIETALALAGGGAYSPCWIDFVGFKMRGEGCMDEFPSDPEVLFRNDAIVLDNVNALLLGETNRVRVAQFVRRGGGLIFMAGYWTLSMGAEHNTRLADVLPVRVRRHNNIVRNDAGRPAGGSAEAPLPQGLQGRPGMALAAADPAFWPADLDWSQAGSAFAVDFSPLKDGVRVLARAGDHPAIVASTCGRGRVVTFLINPHGDHGPQAVPYWRTAQWPRILAACLRWVTEGCEEQQVRQTLARKIDPNAVRPDDLFMDAVGLDGPELTRRLRSAVRNMVDAENARTVLQVALDNYERINDAQLLSTIAEAAAPYYDKSFAPLAARLLEVNELFVRRPGYKALGLAGDRRYRPLVEKGLKEDDPDVRREALTALARLGDPAAAPAVRACLDRAPDKVLALTVLKRLGNREVLARALPLYVARAQERTNAKCGRLAALDDLYGGTSFKLTPAARRKGEVRLRLIQKEEERIAFDLRFFRESLADLTAEERRAVAEFAAQTDRRAVMPVVCDVFVPLPKAELEAYRPVLQKAQLSEVRLLVE